MTEDYGFQKMHSVRQQAKLRRRRQALLVSACVVMGGVGSLTGLLGRKPIFVMPSMASHVAPLKSQYLLVVGLAPETDQKGKPNNQKLRTDTLLVVDEQPQNHRLHVLSIPRATQILIPGYGTARLDSAFPRGGLALTRQILENLLGIQIPHVLAIDLQGAKRAIDRLGGADLFIEQSLHYVDHAGMLSIDLKPGQQHLDGEKALEYARFRGSDFTEADRISRQQYLLNAIEHQAASNVWRLPQLVSDLHQDIQTDLTPGELGVLADVLESRPKMSFTTLPGDVGQDGYWIPDQGRIIKLMNSLNRSTTSAKTSHPLIEIVYAPGQEQRATKLAASLGDHGLTVIRTAPAATGSLLFSRVISRNLSPSLNPILALEVPGLIWELNDDLSPYSADYTVVLGPDFR